MTSERVLECIHVKCARQCPAEHHELLEFLRALARLARPCARHSHACCQIVSFGLLVKDEDSDEDDQGREKRETQRLFDLAGQVEYSPQGLREDDSCRHDQASGQDRIPSCDEAHGSGV